ncbi:MAG TPA: hypothetical protein PKD92_06485 [Novosphingobium sp.]|nr:hypothetical protein [Novosphingobium sp.]HMP56199.1 hypothetical protein [Novosphingobium sp.]
MFGRTAPCRDPERRVRLDGAPTHSGHIMAADRAEILAIADLNFGVAGAEGGQAGH